RLRGKERAARRVGRRSRRGRPGAPAQLVDGRTMHDQRATRANPDFDVAVGDLIVYASHGVGRVSSRESRGGAEEKQEVVVLVFGEGLSVTLPFARALEYVRPVSTEVELTCVRETLRAAEGTRDGVWQKRLRATREKVALGEAIGLAEVIRD